MVKATAAILSLLITISTHVAVAGSRCHKEVLQATLQQSLEKKTGWSSERIAGLNFTQSVAAMSSATIVAGNDDITYQNKRDLSVDIFTLMTASIASRKFYAIGVNSQSWQIFDIKMIDDINE